MVLATWVKLILMHIALITQWETAMLVPEVGGTQRRDVMCGWCFKCLDRRGGMKLDEE